MAVNILSSYLNASQVPYDAKLYAVKLNDLAELGINSNKAFTYYEDLNVDCVENHTTYVWREELSLGETGGILTNGTYVYPANVIANGIDYSGRKFNFFPKSVPGLNDKVSIETYNAGLATKQPNIVVSEDIKVVGDGLQFSDRDKTTNSLGYKYIRSDFDFTAIPTGYDDSTLEIRDFFDLGGATITLPKNVTLYFNGGKFDNVTIFGDNTKIKANLNHIFGLNVNFTGEWSVESVFPEWFGAIADDSTDNLTQLNKALFEVTSNRVLSTTLLLSAGVYRISNELLLYKTTKYSILGTSIGGCEIKQTSDNVPILKFEQVAGQFGFFIEISNISLKYLNPQSSSNTNSVAISLRGNIKGVFNKILIADCAHGFKEQGDTISSWGCNFDNIDVARYSISAMDFRTSVDSGVINNIFGRMSFFNGTGNDYSLLFANATFNTHIDTIEMYGAVTSRAISFGNQSHITINSFKIEQYRIENTNPLFSTSGSKVYFGELSVQGTDVATTDICNVFSNTGITEAYVFANEIRVFDTVFAAGITSVPFTIYGGTTKIFTDVKLYEYFSTSAKRKALGVEIEEKKQWSKSVLIASTTTITDETIETIIVDGLSGFTVINLILDDIWKLSPERIIRFVIKNNSALNIQISYQTFSSGVTATNTQTITSNGIYEIFTTEHGDYELERKYIDTSIL